MTNKRAFISFDYDHDEDIKILLAGQAKHPDSPFDFKDASVKEHLTGDWKEKVRRRMDNIDVVIVLCGQSTHTAKGVSEELQSRKTRARNIFCSLGMPTRTAQGQPPQRPATRCTNGHGTT